MRAMCTSTEKGYKTFEELVAAAKRHEEADKSFTVTVLSHSEPDFYDEKLPVWMFESDYRNDEIDCYDFSDYEYPKIHELVVWLA